MALGDTTEIWLRFRFLSFLWVVAFLWVHQAFPVLPVFLAHHSCVVHLLRLEIAFPWLLDPINESKNPLMCWGEFLQQGMQLSTQQRGTRKRCIDGQVWSDTGLRKISKVSLERCQNFAGPCWFVKSQSIAEQVGGGPRWISALLYRHNAVGLKSDVLCSSRCGLMMGGKCCESFMGFGPKYP